MLASLSLMEEGAALRLPRLGLLRAWLVLALLNVGAVAFLLVCLLDVLKSDAGVNLAMAFASIFTVMTTGSKGVGLLVVYAGTTKLFPRSLFT